MFRWIILSTSLFSPMKKEAPSKLAETVTLLTCMYLEVSGTNRGPDTYFLRFSLFFLVSPGKFRDATSD